MEMFPRLSPWTTLSVPPTMIACRTAPTILRRTVGNLKELELSALSSLNIKKKSPQNCEISPPPQKIFPKYLIL